jgi:hypothetical protein
MRRRSFCAFVSHHTSFGEHTFFCAKSVNDHLSTFSANAAVSESWQGQSHQKAVGGEGQSASVYSPVHFTGPEQQRQRIPVFARKVTKNVYHSTTVVRDVLDLDFPAMAVNATLLIYQPMDSVEQKMLCFTTNCTR